jgi:DNA repair protein RadC
MRRSLILARFLSRAIIHSAYAFILAHNHPSGAMPYPVLRRTEDRVPSGEALSDAA